jgi:hypothetical protein
MMFGASNGRILEADAADERAERIWKKAAHTKYHALFDLLGGLMLLGSLVWIWREHKTAETSVWRNRQFWTCLVITFAMYATMSFVVKNIVVPKLTSGSGHMFSHEHGR